MLEFKLEYWSESQNRFIAQDSKSGFYQSMTISRKKSLKVKYLEKLKNKMRKLYEKYSLLQYHLNSFETDLAPVTGLIKGTEYVREIHERVHVTRFKISDKESLFFQVEVETFTNKPTIKAYKEYFFSSYKVWDFFRQSDFKFKFSNKKEKIHNQLNKYLSNYIEKDKKDHEKELKIKEMKNEVIAINKLI